ncbi:hypothetical protein G6F24_015234 [Rhizopus arrhizus]|nr:hypothetical protein G6F24_015234 [Rhizopus arrhizus]
MALLLDGGGLGVALRDDDAAQVGAVFAGHVLPDVTPHVLAEVDLALAVLRRQEDSPAVVGHADVVEIGPAVGFHADRGAQVDVETVRAVGPHVLPPLQVVGLPMLQRALQGAVAGQVDVIGVLIGVIDSRHVSLLFLFRPGSSRMRPVRPCRTASARPCRRPHWDG